MMVDIPICAQKPTGTPQLLSCCPKTIPKHQISHRLDMGRHSAGGTPEALGMPEGTWKSTARENRSISLLFSRSVWHILARDLDKHKTGRRTGGA